MASSLRQGTIPLKGEGCIGCLHLTGDKQHVEEMMAKVVEFIRNTLHAEWLENQVPENAKPGGCGGCGH